MFSFMLLTLTSVGFITLGYYCVGNFLSSGRMNIRNDDKQIGYALVSVSKTIFKCIVYILAVIGLITLLIGAFYELLSEVFKQVLSKYNF